MILYPLAIDLIQVGGVEACLKKSQRCNLHAECSPAEGSDTAEDELDCDNEYRKKKLIPKQATFRCQSPDHNDDSVRNNRSLGVVWIRAALNDGKEECWKGEDEVERSTDWETYGIPGLDSRLLNRIEGNHETASHHHMTKKLLSLN